MSSSSSFFKKARDRAQEAAASLTGSGQHHDGSSSSSSSFTYTGSLPHVFRQGVASLDPRFESTRSLHVMRGALKAVAIDGQALARETKTAAAKVFKWGQDHAREDRLDGVADEPLADVTDRLAAIMSMLGDLELDHSQRLVAARRELKEAQQAEQELASSRSQRTKAVKELQSLVGERQKPGGHARADELEAQLKQLESEAKGGEEHVAQLKRRQLQRAFDAQMDSYIEYGEKLALVASYGKLLMQQVPVDEAPAFPASKHGLGSKAWPGAAKTAQIRALVEPALKAYVPRTPVPQLNAQGSKGIADDAASFGTSHAHELAEDDDEFHDASDADVHPPVRSPLPPNAPVPLSPLPEGGAPNPRWNHSPSTIPPASHVASPPAAPAGVGVVPLPAASDEVIEDSAPPGPTVAETGAVLASSPGGPGPKTGVLERRRPSGASTTMPRPPPALPARPGVHARLRRDGTITRRGVDADYEQAEADNLPPYSEMDEKV